MRKIALLLALVLVIGLAAGCNKEENRVMVPRYQIYLPNDGTWTVAEESDYDLEMDAGSLKIRAVAYSPADFVDMPTAEELFQEHNEDLAGLYQELTVAEQEKSYNSGAKTIWVTVYSAGDETIVSAMVSLGNEAESVIWLALSGPAKDVEKYRGSFDSMLKNMTCDAEPEDPDAMEDVPDPEELETQEMLEDPGTPEEERMVGETEETQG